MTQPRLRDLVRASNPVVDADQLLSDEQDVLVLYAKAMQRAGKPPMSTDLLAQPVERRRDMQTQETPTEQTEEHVRKLEPGPPRSRRWIPALAAGFVIVAIVVGAVALLQSDEPSAPAAPLPAPEAPDRNAEAVAKVEAFYATLATGDIDAIAALTRPDGVLDGIDRNLWEWDAVFAAAGYGPTVDGCDAVPDAPEADSYVTVRCTVSFSNPVAAAAGAGSDQIESWWVWHNGRMDWQFPEGDDDTDVGIYAEYLKAHHPVEYEAACNPAPYYSAGMSIQANKGTAFTGACAELVVPLLPEMAQWVQAGRPAP